MSSEKLSADNNAAYKFIEQLKTETKNYGPEFVCSTNEKSLNWKALPHITLASKRETSAPGHKVTCDNAYLCQFSG